MKIFDSHFHIIGYNYPVIPNHGYLPPEFTIDSYRSSTKDFEVVGGAVVSGSFQAFDQEYLKNALNQLGSNFFGVANIPYDIQDEEIRELSNHRVTAVRFNLKRGGSERIDHLEPLSKRLFDDFGWHSELYVDSKDLPDLRTVLAKLNHFTIDHLGLSKVGFRELLYWAEKGMKIKATGFGRIDFDPIEPMKKIHEVNPNSLMFGTDLPSTRATRPFSIEDIHLIQDNFDRTDQEKIFCTNAQEWYSK